MTKAPAPPQIISAYPSCENCLSWSEAGLAIAGGENVYFASDRDAQSQHASNHDRIQVLRVDTFDHNEWPDAPMATIADVSIGEEQSESIVSALAWSPPGLGIHRRCVLAVLTSNLVLALWETDGSRNSWRRTCIVNNHAAKSFSSDSEILPTNLRRSSRVRAFVWLPPLKQSDDDRWGVNLLLSADDQKTVTLWRISKEERHQYGSWSVVPVAQGPLPDSSPKETVSMTALQLSLLRAQTVERLVVDNWQSKKAKRKNCMTLQAAALFNNSTRLNSPVSIEVRIEFQGNDISATLSLCYRDLHMQNPGLVALQGVDESIHWERELGIICADYRRKFRLRSVRTRFWGSTRSPNGRREAAVVTLHPRDSYEYTTPNTEKSWLLIRALDDEPALDEQEEKPWHEVCTTTLAYILHRIQDKDYSDNELDNPLLNVWTTWTGLQEALRNENRLLASALNAIETNGPGVQAPVTQTKPNPAANITSAELCALCQSPLAMDVEAQNAICELGHPFPRCSLSLLAIQEPRISKFCSDCERQYLDLTKLGPTSPGTLIAELFEKFDVCPVCQGKFRS